jgi:hypothetical protein
MQISKENFRMLPKICSVWASGLRPTGEWHEYRKANKKGDYREYHSTHRADRE